MGSISITSSSTSFGRTMTLTCTQRTDIANNRSYIDWTLKTEGNGGGWLGTGPTTVTINGVQAYYSARVESSAFPAITGSTSGTVTVNHNNDGKKTITVSLSTAIYVFAISTDSRSWTLDSIPRQASISSAPNFNDTDNPTITYSNPAGTVVTELVAGIYDTAGQIAYVGYRDLSKTSTSYTFDLTEAERNNLRSACANSNTMTVRYYIRTKIGETYYYQSVDKTLTITNATPTISSATAVDVNSTTTALTGSSSKIVKGYSNLRISGISASTYKYATLKSVVIDDISETYTSSYTRTINGYTKNNVAIKVVDSRGNTSSALTKTFSFVDYFAITKGNVSATRASSGVGEGVTLVLNGTWFNGSFGSVTNTLTASYRYKRTTATSWTTGATSLTVTKSGNNFSINQSIRGDLSTGFDLNNSYDVEVIFTDKLSTATFSTAVGAGSPAISIYENKIALGGKFDTSLDLDVQFKRCPFPVGFIYMSTTSTNPSTYFGGTWEQIAKGRTLVGVDTSDSDFSTVKKTGGEKTHKLTVSEMPSHTHNYRLSGGYGGLGSSTENNHGKIYGAKDGSWWNYTFKVDEGEVIYSTGGDTAHNNLQPYYTCYIWCRTA